VPIGESRGNPAQTIDRKTRDSLVIAIIRRITTGAIAIDEELSERHLAMQLGVSRVPIREALTLLVRDGIVAQVPRVGVRVLMPTSAEVEELFLLRLGLEPLGVERLASNAHASLGRVESFLTAADEARREEQGAAFLEMEAQFHISMAETAGYRAAAVSLAAWTSRLRIYRAGDPPSNIEMNNMLVEDLDVWRAIQGGDAAAALDHIRRHLMDSSSRFLHESPLELKSRSHRGAQEVASWQSSPVAESH